jgi:CDGSH-type Zn-finger protein
VSDAEILIVDHGPYVVSGAVPLFRLERDESGAWTEGPAIPTDASYVLCRCGASTELPFCDEGKTCRKLTEGNPLVRFPRPVSWDVPSSSPAIALKANGPMRVRGVALSASDGTVFEPADRCSLCRCGRSNTMPFCDGTHKEVGFRG